MPRGERQMGKRASHQGAAVERAEPHDHGRRHHRHHHDADQRDDVDRIATAFGQQVAAGEEEREVHAPK